MSDRAEENKRVLQSFYDAGNRGDMDHCMELIADNIIWRNMGTTSLSGTFEGKGDLMQRLLGPLFGRLKAGIRMEPEKMIAEGDHVVAMTSGFAETHEGEAYNNSYCWVVRVRDGKIAEVTEFLDTDLVKRVFG